jgi:hypothetical protein
MPIASQTDAQSTPGERRRDALRSLLAALGAAPPPPVFVWLVPGGRRLSSSLGRKS